MGPRVFNPDMTQQSTCRRFPTLWNNFCSATHLERIFKGHRFFAGEHMFYFPHDRTLAVDVIVGCFSMIRREAFDDVGLLDEDLFMYGDDVDWCRRARNAGWQVVFYPGAQAIHDRGKTTAPFPVHFAVAQQRSVLRYWTKHHSFLGCARNPEHHALPSFAALRDLGSVQLSAFSERAAKPCAKTSERRLPAPTTLRRRAPEALAAIGSMSISNSISRFAEYYKRHGLAATMRRAKLAAKRALFAGRMVVFYCDLDRAKTAPSQHSQDILSRTCQGSRRNSARNIWRK